MSIDDISLEKKKKKGYNDISNMAYGLTCNLNKFANREIDTLTRFGDRAGFFDVFLITGIMIPVAIVGILETFFLPAEGLLDRAKFTLNKLRRK